jgi:hypothetical protein
LVNPTLIHTLSWCQHQRLPGGLMQQIELEPEDTCLYHRLLFDYHYGLEGPYPIYSQKQIDESKRSPEFGREFELQYLGVVGNVFSQQSIENTLKVQYNHSNINPNAKKSVGLDPGFGSSNFAICVTQLVDGKIQVIHAEEHDRPDFSDMISEVWKLQDRCGGHINNIYVDAANPVVWQSLKREFDEPSEEQRVREKIAYAKKYNLYVEDQMRIVPVPFAIEGAKMLQNVKWLLEEKDEDDSSLIAIHKERFHKLVTALRTAVANEYKLDKEQTSCNDILDAFRLSLQFYKRKKAW